MFHKTLRGQSGPSVVLLGALGHGMDRAIVGFVGFMGFLCGWSR